MTDEWYYARKGERFGPVPLAKVKSLADKGWLMPDDLVWRPGMTDWRPAVSVKGLFRSSLIDSLGSTVDGIVPGRQGTPEKPGRAAGGDSAEAAAEALFDWSEISPRHLVAACGGFIAALGIAFTAIAPSSLGLAFTLGGLALAAAGLYVELGRLVGQSLANLATARREAAERRLEMQRLAVEQKKLEVEAARLAAEKAARERPAPPAPPPVPAATPVEPTRQAGQPRLVPAEHYGAGAQVTVINHPPVQRWSPALAAVLSMLLPGLGQVYKGQVLNGVVWFFLVGVGYLALILPGLLLHFFCIVGAASGNPWTPGRTEVVRR
jgi:TM2 domain-containing membrane protein YozV